MMLFGLRSPSLGGFAVVLWWVVNMRLRVLFGSWNLDFFTKCQPHGRVQRQPTASNGTGLRVLQASPGHMGTTSMSLALYMLGLRSFHSDDFLVYLPELLHDDADLAGLLRSCRVEALALQHWLELIPEVVAASPGVKVILSMRDWRSFKRAEARHFASLNHWFVEGSFHAIDIFCHWLPYHLLWPARSVGLPITATSVTSLVQEYCHFQVAHRFESLFPTSSLRRMPRSGGRYSLEHFYGQLYPRMLESEELYEDYRQLVRRLVPRDRLLEFDLGKHSWEELAAFVGAPAIPREPFPRKRGGGSPHPTTTYWHDSPGKIAAFWLLMLLCMALNGLGFALAASSVGRLLGLVLSGSRASRARFWRRWRSVGAVLAAAQAAALLALLWQLWLA